jgi:hypothetical protein
MCDTTSSHIKSWVRPKWQPMPYIVHTFWPEPYVLWSQLVLYKGNRVPFGMPTLSTPPSHDRALCVCERDDGHGGWSALLNN